MGALTWGLGMEQIKAKWPKATMYDQRLNLGGSACLQNFTGDCGALILTGANSVTEKDLQDVKEYASLSGFSKIFATIVTSKTYADRQLKIFEDANFQCISKGNSNRNDHKKDYVMFIRIDCDYKGY